VQDRRNTKGCGASSDSNRRAAALERRDAVKHGPLAGPPVEVTVSVDVHLTAGRDCHKALRCPNCDGNYLQHDCVTVYDRPADAAQVRKTTVDERVTVELVEAETSGSPIWRGVASRGGAARSHEEEVSARMTPLDIALGYLKRGWNPLPVSRESKKPIGLEWQKRRLSAQTAPKHFNGGAVNVGVQMGNHSNGLTDVDLDCREALVIGALLLPRTKAVFGRKSKPRSHWLYVTGLAEKIDKATQPFRDVDGKNPKPDTMMLELRIGGAGKGAQSVFSGSLHESGEPIEWDNDGVAVTVDDDKLLRAVQRIAAATLLARHWPVEGSRHDAALTVGGVLASVGLDAGTAALTLEAIAKAAKDKEWRDRAQADTR
jgi:hypothetical protein